MKIRSKKDLDEAIIELEKRKAIQHGIMMHQYRETSESIKLKNIMRRVFSNLAHSPEAKSGLLKAAAGIGISLLTKKLLWGNSPSFLKKLFGNAVKVGIAKTAISNVDKVKAYSTAIYHNLFRKPKAQP
jgi:hypothetical protein